MKRGLSSVPKRSFFLKVHSSSISTPSSLLYDMIISMKGGYGYSHPSATSLEMTSYPPFPLSSATSYSFLTLQLHSIWMSTHNNLLSIINIHVLTYLYIYTSYLLSTLYTSYTIQHYTTLYNIHYIPKSYPSRFNSVPTVALPKDKL